GSAAEYLHERSAPPGRCHSTEARRAAGRRRPTFGNQASLWTTRTQAILRRQLFGATDGDVKVLPDTVLDAVDAAMNRQRLPAVPGVLDNGGVADVGDLLDDVEFAHAVELGLFARETGDVVAVFVVQVANGAQPAVNQAQLVVTHRCTHAAATVVAGDQNVFDLEDIDGVLDHRQAVEVGVQHHVGDVTVDEQVAGQHAHDLVGRHAGIGAADPEILGLLLLGQLAEEVRVFLEDGLGPARVVFD